MKKVLWTGLLCMLLAAGCTNPLPVIEGVDRNAWKKDRNGCLGLRRTMDSTLLSQKSKLEALSETQIISLLGKPDQNELYKRNQKFYRYYITPSPECGETTESPAALVIRFNAVGLAKEITIE